MRVHDRRTAVLCRMRFCLAAAIILMLAVLAVAAPKDDTITQSHELDKIQWWLIGGAFTIIQTLIGFIYVSGMSEVKGQLRELHRAILDIHESKLSKEDHAELCRRVVP